MTIDLSKQAVKELLSADATTTGRIFHGLLKVPKGDVLPIVEKPGYFRLRVGNWRVLFAFTASDTIDMAKILPRGAAYMGVNLQ